MNLELNKNLSKGNFVGRVIKNEDPDFTGRCKVRVFGLMDELEQYSVQDCIECGCCLYTCPANIPLLDVIRLAKGDVIKIIRARAAAQKK